MIQGKTDSMLFCPCCNHKVNGFTGLGTEDRPNDGDICVCIYCYSINQYTNNLTELRKMTNDELTRLSLNHPKEWENIRGAIKAIYKVNNNIKPKE